MEKVKLVILHRIAQCEMQINACNDIFRRNRGLDDAVKVIMRNHKNLHAAKDRLEDLRQLLELVEELE